MELTGVGVWSSQLRYGDPSESADAAAELDDLGFAALWIPDAGGQVFDAVGHLLAATKRTVIATGILNLWMHSASDVAVASFLTSITLSSRITVRSNGGSRRASVSVLSPVLSERSKATKQCT